MRSTAGLVVMLVIAAAPSPGTPQGVQPSGLEAGPPLATIRRGLERAGPLSSAGIPPERQPTFRVTVRGTLFRLPPIEETLVPEWQPVGPPGSLYHAEFLARVTRPELMPYAAFTSAELAQVTASTLGANLVFQAVSSGAKAVRGGVRRYQRARTRADINEAIAAIESNRRAAGLPTTAHAKKR